MKLLTGSHEVVINFTVADGRTLEYSQTIEVLSSDSLEGQAEVELLTLTPHQATIDGTELLEVSAKTETLHMVTWPAAVTVPGNVVTQATTEELVLTTYPASISAGALVEAATESLTITTNQASIGRDVDVEAAEESLTITTNAATIESSGATTLTAQDITNIVDALFAKVIENGETFEQQLKLIRAEAAGKVAVSGNTVTFRDAADTTDRIAATVDSNGQRTAIITDVS